MIKIKHETLFGHTGFALYIDGHRAHLGIFTNLKGLRKYWHSFRSSLSTKEDIDGLIW